MDLPRSDRGFYEEMRRNKVREKKGVGGLASQAANIRHVTISSGVLLP